MAIRTYTEQLEEVQAAISKVLVGQSYSMGGRTLTRADLASLQKREEYLRPLAEREGNGGGYRIRRAEIGHD